MLKSMDYASDYRDDKYLSPNVTLLPPGEPIKTGDYIHVLANSDGTFVWQD